MDLELINQLHAEINYKDLEKAEVVYKQELISLAKNKDYQKVLDLSYKIGFLFKQKAYGVKCSLPTGYSLFLLNQNEGFSYQRHESFKIELFHFFRPDQTTFCYLAPYNKFLETSSKQNLEDFHVNKNGAHDRHCIKPKTGDVVIIKNIGDVHTVIGGVFEEFANTSLDHVTRIFDQNKDKQVVLEPRQAILKRLLNENYNFPMRIINTSDEGEFKYRSVLSQDYSSSVEYDLFNTTALAAKHLKIQNNALLDTKDKWFSVLNVGEQELEVRLHNAIIYLNKLGSVIIPPHVNLGVRANDAHVIMCGIPELLF